ncbi:MAG: hypothetical protein AB7F76_09645, partial [Parvibaculaceae bacterium]
MPFEQQRHNEARGSGADRTREKMFGKTQNTDIGFCMRIARPFMVLGSFGEGTGCAFGAEISCDGGLDFADRDGSAPKPETWRCGERNIMGDESVGLHPLDWSG